MPFLGELVDGGSDGVVNFTAAIFVDEMVALSMRSAANAPIRPDANSNKLTGECLYGPLEIRGTMEGLGRGLISVSHTTVITPLSSSDDNKPSCLTILSFSK